MLDIREKLPVFISWAEDRSKAVARALRNWIPMILQNTDPWMSAIDIGSGERWSPAIAKRLSASRFGILCLTPENVSRPWLLFEAGAIAKAIEADARVCPYLFGFEKTTDVPAGPISQFQAKLATEDQTLELMRDLNKALGNDGVQPDQLERLFGALWPQLKTDLETIPATLPAAPKKRTVDDIVPEILETVRNIERRMPENTSIQRAFDARFWYDIGDLKAPTGARLVQMERVKLETAVADASALELERGIQRIRELLNASKTLEPVVNLLSVTYSPKNGVVLARVELPSETLRARVYVPFWWRMDNQELVASVIVPITEKLADSLRGKGLPPATE